MVEFPYWTDNWFATRAIKSRFERLKEQVRDARAESAGDLRSILSAIDQLEVDIGRTLLKVHAIADVLEAKKLVTTEELAEKARELDSMDGEMDGILHPAVFRTEDEQNRVPSPRAFLFALEIFPYDRTTRRLLKINRFQEHGWSIPNFEWLQLPNLHIAGQTYVLVSVYWHGR